VTSAAPGADGLALGVDIGGTFTDAVLRHDGRVVARVKAPTTDRDPGIGFAAVVERLRRSHGLTHESLAMLVHATTVATNAIIEGRTARLALVVTAGFRDVLEIARQIRPDLFDLHRQKPPPLVPRDLVFEVDERLGPAGETIRPLDARSVAGVVAAIRRLELDGVVVSLLHAYADPSHERMVSDAIRAARPDLDVSASSEIWPEFREYFRTSTALVNAAVRPIVRRYLATLLAALGEADLHRRFWVMQSSGGLMTAETASRLPVHLIESGPAAGLIGASDLGRRMGWHNVISLDIGGTTAKVGLIVGGRPRVTHEYEVGAIAASMGGRTKASGYPIRTPVLDLVEIGAGGGSIAWVDPGGALRVGPRSAGADPGPACYGQGGTAPTVTDANLVLGRIDPGYFLGGEIPLHAEASRAAIDRACAAPLGIDVEATARGIIAVANATMVRALRLVTVQRGYDPREFVLVAFGGAGPLHANALAVELGVPRVVVPPHPGVFSAAGLLLAEVQHVVTATEVVALDALTTDALRERFSRLGRRAAHELADQGIARDRISRRHYADMRYRGQSYELAIAVDPDEDGDVIDRLRSAFLAEHRRQYGHATRDASVEVVNWKVYAVAASAAPMGEPRQPGREPSPKGSNGPNGPKGPAIAEPSSRPSLRRDDLMVGEIVRGPAIVVDVDATTYVEDGWSASRSEDDDLVLMPADR
jgi:N-methylhydantoinase A